jgi:hypothetical protein
MPKKDTKGNDTMRAPNAGLRVAALRDHPDNDADNAHLVVK